MWRFSLSRVSPSPSTSRPRCGGPLCLVSLPLPLHPGQDVEVLSVSCLSLSLYIQAKMWRFSLSRVSPSLPLHPGQDGGSLCLVSLPLHPGQDVEVLSVSCLSLSLYIQAKMWRSSLSRVSPSTSRPRCGGPLCLVSLPLHPGQDVEVLSVSCLSLSLYIQAKMWRSSLSRVSPSPSTSRPRCGGPLCLVSLPLPLHPGQDVEVLSVSCLSLSLYIQAKMWRSSLSRVSPSTSRPRCGGPLCLVSLPLHPGQDVEVLSVSCLSLSLYIQAKMWRSSLSRVSPSQRLLQKLFLCCVLSFPFENCKVLKY
ncbi:uncharacterized protein LOC127915926 isoform X10 [Oncorhynchus keta]|uniref:uncharacterized protein LOC127915926 isoform X10 n=1 Tax=Oncorhynchus keta TaxID=8018 RepID=UPI00227AFAB0|nr:uncharacterized protein LOC127915926 isoform X10 [Oncorhynchus keta]